MKPKFRSVVFGLISVCILAGCSGARQAVQIPDFLLVPNGIEILNSQPLTGFIFENHTKNHSIEMFLNNKFKSDNFSEKKFLTTIDGDKYIIILYDEAEFEKYFGSANYSVMNLETTNSQYDTQRRFIAISMVDSNNHDCLADTSLFQNIATNYLKALKEEYYNASF